MPPDVHWEARLLAADDGRSRMKRGPWACASGRTPCRSRWRGSERASRWTRGRQKGGPSILAPTLDEAPPPGLNIHRPAELFNLLFFCQNSVFRSRVPRLERQAQYLLSPPEAMPPEPQRHSNSHFLRLLLDFSMLTSHVLCSSMECSSRPSSRGGPVPPSSRCGHALKPLIFVPILISRRVVPFGRA